MGKKELKEREKICYCPESIKEITTHSKKKVKLERIVEQKKETQQWGYSKIVFDF